MSRHFVFTLNNPDHHFQDHQFGLDAMPDPVTFFTYQLEEGEEKTPHFQGYIQCSRKTTRSKISRILGGVAYIKEAKGTPAQAVGYANKMDGRLLAPCTDGVLNPSIGVLSAAKPRAPQAVKRKRDEIKDKVVKIYCGIPGSGKTYAARNFLGDNIHDWPAKSDASNTRWCGEYCDEANILIDEWKPSDFSVDALATILGTFPGTVPATMGGKTTVLTAKKIVLTTNKSHDEVMAYLEKHPKLKRRVNEVRVFNFVRPEVADRVSGPKIFFEPQIFLENKSN